MPIRFWLISVDDYAVTVALSGKIENNFQIQSVGVSVVWQHPQTESFFTAVDESLASAADQIQLPPEMEPNSAAFVIPSTWTDVDGKMNSSYKKLVEQLCLKLKLKPLGFISHDEAITENSSADEGLPVSFILLYLTPVNFDLSLVYLGKIKSRHHQTLSEPFSPSTLEEALNHLSSDSTLPPQVIITGHFDDNIIDNLRNYSWIGKKTIETFLHFPEFSPKKIYESITNYNQIISHQFQPEQQLIETPSTPVSIDDQDYAPVEKISQPEEAISEVKADSLGFDFTQASNEPAVEIIPEPEIEIPLSSVPSAPTRPRFKFKISLPKIHIPLSINLLIIPALSPLLIILLIFFYKTELTLFFTPYDISDSSNIILDPVNKGNDPSTISVTEKKIDINISLSASTTGKKTIGDKAKGQITIFNKTDKTQNLPKGTILNSGNLSYLLTNSVQVPASSTNFDLGVITMGQMKATIEAKDIGPEFNISKDQAFQFKDIPSATIQVKMDTPPSGGTKSEVSTVTAIDKQKLTEQIKQAVTEEVNKKIDQDVNGLSGLLAKTININHSRNEFNREVGEEATELTIESANTITVFLLEKDVKKSIINQFISSHPEYGSSTYDIEKFSFDFSPTNDVKTKGNLSISGQIFPNPDVESFRHLLAGKKIDKLNELIHSQFPRVYNYLLTGNIPVVSKFIMPIRWQNITIITK